MKDDRRRTDENNQQGYCRKKVVDEGPGVEVKGIEIFGIKLAEDDPSDGGVELRVVTPVVGESKKHRGEKPEGGGVNPEDQRLHARGCEDAGHVQGEQDGGESLHGDGGDVADAQGHEDVHEVVDVRRGERPVGGG